MANIAALRSGIATNLSTISGLRVTDTIPDQINPPQAILSLSGVSFDKAMHKGLTQYTFTLTVIVARQSERTGQAKLDTYVQSTGSNSIKLAVESDRTLGGAAYDCVVPQVTSYGVTTIGEINYISGEFEIVAYAS
jgi:uncharacterized protein YqfA (UPF0365 family)